MSFAASKCQLMTDGSTAHTLTSRDHGLDEISYVTQDNTKALDTATFSAFGIHRFDLHALQHWVFQRGAIGLEDAPVAVLAGSLPDFAGVRT